MYKRAISLASIQTPQIKSQSTKILQKHIPITTALAPTTSSSSNITPPTNRNLANLSSTLKSTLARNLPRNMSTSTAKPTPPMKVTLRPWNSRGHADHGWLYTFHTFSFASYFSPKHNGLGALRVINEDRVERGTGFGTHPHREFLIWSYVVAGELEHKDSLGNVETLRRGDVQFTSAGTGVRHSEFNRNATADNHFLQIWAKPDVRGLAPAYVTRHFDEAAKTDRLLKVMQAAKRGEGTTGGGEAPITLHADLDMYASVLAPGKVVEQALVDGGKDRQLYLQVVMTGKEQPKTGGAKIKVGDVVLREGDGAHVVNAAGTVTIESVGDKPAEFLLFDLGKDEN